MIIKPLIWKYLFIFLVFSETHCLKFFNIFGGMMGSSSVARTKLSMARNAKARENSRQKNADNQRLPEKNTQTTPKWETVEVDMSSSPAISSFGDDTSSASTRITINEQNGLYPMKDLLIELLFTEKRLKELADKKLPNFDETRSILGLKTRIHNLRLINFDKLGDEKIDFEAGSISVVMNRIFVELMVDLSVSNYNPVRAHITVNDASFSGSIVPQTPTVPTSSEAILISFSDVKLNLDGDIELKLSKDNQDSKLFNQIYQVMNNLIGGFMRTVMEKILSVYLNNTLLKISETMISSNFGAILSGIEKYLNNDKVAMSKLSTINHPSVSISSGQIVISGSPQINGIPNTMLSDQEWKEWFKGPAPPHWKASNF